MLCVTRAGPSRRRREPVGVAVELAGSNRSTPRTSPRSRARAAPRPAASNARPGARAGTDAPRMRRRGATPVGSIAAAVAPDDVLPHGRTATWSAALAFLHPRRDDVDHRPDLGRVETRARRAADRERDAVALERHHLGRAAHRHVLVVAIPEREQDMTVLGDENADRAVLLGPLLAVGAQRLAATCRAAASPARRAPARAGRRTRPCCRA